MKRVEISEARAAGLTWYFTGRPCKHGHVARRSTATGNCKRCHYLRTHAKQKREQADGSARTKHKGRFERNTAAYLVRWAKNRAKQQGLPFDLTPEDVVVPAVCPVFGTPFVFFGNRHPQRPSLDKLKPELGYVRGNVAVISFRANRVKSDATASELRDIAAWMDRE